MRLQQALGNEDANRRLASAEADEPRVLIGHRPVARDGSPRRHAIAVSSGTRTATPMSTPTPTPTPRSGSLQVPRPRESIRERQSGHEHIHHDRRSRTRSLSPLCSKHHTHSEGEEEERGGGEDEDEDNRDDPMSSLSDRPPSSPRMSQSKRRSNISSAGAVSSWQTMSQLPGQRGSYSLSRRSSQSSIRSVRTVATTYSINSTATSTSICSAKFERAYANQSHVWTSASSGIVRHPSMSSQYSVASIRTVPPHVVGKRTTLQKQLKVVETLLRDTPNLVLTETGSIGWLLAHERHLLKVAIKYDERAHSEWEAAQDWQLSAQEGPVSKIFVTQPSRFGLTPEQHQHRIGQARTLGNNALDLWRFSDLSHQDAYKIRGAREKLQAEQTKGPSSTTTTLPTSAAESSASMVEQGAPKTREVRKDFQTWLKEVSKGGGDEGFKSVVMVKDDGTLSKLERLTLSSDPPPVVSKPIVSSGDSDRTRSVPSKPAKKSP